MRVIRGGSGERHFVSIFLPLTYNFMKRKCVQNITMFLNLKPRTIHGGNAFVFLLRLAGHYQQFFSGFQSICLHLSIFLNLFICFKHLHRISVIYQSSVKSHINTFNNSDAHLSSHTTASIHHTQLPIYLQYLSLMQIRETHIVESANKRGFTARHSARTMIVMTD